MLSTRLAGRIGAPVVIVHPPSPGRPLVRWATGPLKEARAQDVSVAVEDMPRGRAKRLFSIRRRSCHKPEHLLGIGDVTLDTSHIAASGLDLMEAYGKLADQLHHIYLSDSDLSGGDQHRLPGKGKLLLKEFLARLGGSEYPGAVSLELQPWPLGAPDSEVMKRMRDALRFAREGLEENK